MLELIITIAIAVLISYFKSSSRKTERQANTKQQKQNVWDNVAYQAPKKNTRTTPAREQVRQQTTTAKKETPKPAILERAVSNAEENIADVTLQTMEAEHNHSERVAPATHHHPEDIIPENMLGNIEDLMAKGYDGNLCFERDFVGEAMDMISRFSLGGNYGA